MRSKKTDSLRQRIARYCSEYGLGKPSDDDFTVAVCILQSLADIAAKEESRIAEVIKAGTLPGHDAYLSNQRQYWHNLDCGYRWGVGLVSAMKG